MSSLALRQTPKISGSPETSRREQSPETVDGNNPAPLERTTPRGGANPSSPPRPPTFNVGDSWAVQDCFHSDPHAKASMLRSNIKCWEYEGALIYCSKWCRIVSINRREFLCLASDIHGQNTYIVYMDVRRAWTCATEPLLERRARSGAP